MAAGTTRNADASVVERSGLLQHDGYGQQQQQQQYDHHDADGEGEEVPLHPESSARGITTGNISFAAEDAEDERQAAAVRLVNTHIARIGMGKYQWRLFILCGFGWFCDNFWLAGISLVLPNIKRQFDIPTATMGLGTTFAFVGMMIGAGVWGPLSDIIGRRPAFTFTLAIASVFGGLAAYARSFEFFCLMMLGMGIGTGGNLPVDGALFLEFVPPSHRSLLTLLSLFWPVGQLMASTLAWAIIPLSSCPLDDSSPPIGNSTAIILPPCDVNTQNRGWRFFLTSMTFVTFTMLIGRVLLFRLLESPKFLVGRGRADDAVATLEELARVNGTTCELRRDELRRVLVSSPESAALTSSNRKIEGWATKSADALRGFTLKLRALFRPDLKRTTLLIWAIWSLISCGYTIFNGFLTVFLADVPADTPPPTPSETFRDIFIISMMGIPGSVLGMQLIDTRLGRIGAISTTTVLTSLSLFLFPLSHSKSLQLLFSCLTSTLQNCVYGILYAYTPEVFGADVRGTATGVASSLSRVFGMLAPLISGVLLEVGGVIMPVWVSSGLFFLAAGCMVFLPVETRGREVL